MLKQAFGSITKRSFWLTSILFVLLAYFHAAGQQAGQNETNPAEARVESNVVFGMYSGLALLMDVHHPQTPNGYGIICIPGSGFHSPMGFNAWSMKDNKFLLVMYQPLLAAGYTVFVINHREAPRFRYPAAVEDAERAVRFIRHNAQRFGVSAERIGGVGASSGGYLVSMLGVRNSAGKNADDDPVERQSAHLQAVVAFSPPEDLTGNLGALAASALGSFIGTIRLPNPNSPEWKLYREASPISYVGPHSAPMLLIHGERDDLIPPEQSEKMASALAQANVASRLIRVPGAGHDDLMQRPEYREFTSEMVKWLDRYLRMQK